MRRNTIILICIILGIILVVSLIFYIKNSDGIDDETIKCIAEKSELYVSKTCSACAQQKEILGNYISLFNMTDCIDNSEECKINNIFRIPTWIIDSKQYTGVKSLNDLKSLTNC